uniref:Uncharacterized protein n=1 Tax=Anguilla anguilla TaxID=7936 RepID=A0A0E9XPH9_ANGAN
MRPSVKVISYSLHNLKYEHHRKKFRLNNPLWFCFQPYTIIVVLIFSCQFLKLI